VTSIRDEQLPGPATEGTTTNGVDDSPLRILLIEDDADDALIVREGLAGASRPGVVVEWVDRLSTGLDRLGRGGIDVVLLDLSLPDSLGTETFHQVHEDVPGVPIVVLTGLNDEVLGAQLIREGGQDYLVKGQINSTLLTRSINYALERKRVEEVIRRFAEETAVLAEIGRIISSSLEIADVYERFSEQVLKLIPCDRIAVSLVDHEAWHLDDAYVHGAAIPGRKKGGTSPLARTCEEVVVRTRKGLLIQGPTREDLLIRHPDLSHGLQAGLRSFLAVPLISRDRVIGILQLSSSSTSAFSQSDLRLLERIGAQIAGATASSQLYAQLRQAEARLVRQAQELERSNAELEQFAYVASHDLQEPLRMVTSYVQILAQDYDGKLDPDADRFIGYVVDGADRMKVLINDLLEYSRVGSRARPMEPTDCEELMGQVTSDLEAAISESGGEVAWGSLPVVTVDPTQMAQLLRNLVSNAVKFRGGAAPLVHVSAEITARGAGAAGDLPAGAREWVFSVRDNGIGIAPKYHERIFQMFERLHHRSEYPGTGIGLAICQKIVERHGGRIWVESEPGKGSDFRFTIPIRD
jgi:signal transduction histidine kinase/CheY-like chemotaxis protein